MLSREESYTRKGSVSKASLYNLYDPPEGTGRLAKR
jgi:hypothetical protein